MCETLVIKVKSLNLILIVVYRPPKCSVAKFCEALEVCQKAIDDVTEKDPKVKDILQFGDYNLPCISWPSHKIYVKHVENKSEEKKQAEFLVKYVEENFLENYIYTATREKNILDLVFTNNHLLVNDCTTTINNKLSDHYLLNVKLNFSYNNLNKVEKATNPYSTKIFEFNISEADLEDWEKFEAILDTSTVNFESETKNDNTETKLEKFYSHLERATAIVFEKKKDFIEIEDKDEGIDINKQTTKNKIPKHIRNLMRRKSKLSGKILASTSWEKNYKTMTELRKVKDELGICYKERRLKVEKEAIRKLKRIQSSFIVTLKLSPKLPVRLQPFLLKKVR